MGLLSSKLRTVEGGGLMYYCQGCDMVHQVRVGDGAGPRWGWNGDAQCPTFNPSVLVTWDQLSEAGRAKEQVFKKQHGRWPTREELPADVQHRCHTFVRDGMVQFLADCTHHLAGTVQALPDLPDWLR